jgi:adenylosuccinate synthase
MKNGYIVKFAVNGYLHIIQCINKLVINVFMTMNEKIKYWLRKILIFGTIGFFLGLCFFSYKYITFKFVG